MTGIRLESGEVEVEVVLEEGAASIGGETFPFRELLRGGSLSALEIGGEIFPVRVARIGDRAFVWCAGEEFVIRRAAAAARRPAGTAGEAHAELVAPMPGRIRRTFVSRGEAVAKGQLVLVLEAMKMEHAIRAQRSGILSRLGAREGDLVEAGAVLAEIT